MCYHPSAFREEGAGSLSLDKEKAFERADTTFVFRPRGPLVRVRGFLLPQTAARSLKTQQRETSRPLAGVSLGVDMNPSSFPLEDDRIRLASAFGQRRKVSSRRV